MARSIDFTRPILWRVPPKRSAASSQSERAEGLPFAFGSPDDPQAPHNSYDFSHFLFPISQFCTILSRLTKIVITFPKQADADAILTIKEVATYLKVTERMIYRLSQAKKMPSFKVGQCGGFCVPISTAG